MASSSFFLMTNKTRWITSTHHHHNNNNNCSMLMNQYETKTYLFPHFTSTLTTHCHYFPDRLLRLLLLLLRCFFFIDTIFTRDYQSFEMAQLSRKLKKTFIFFSSSSLFFFYSDRDEKYIRQSEIWLVAAHDTAARLPNRLSVPKEPYRINFVSLFS